MGQEGPSIVFEDNQAEISIAQKEEQSKRSKHYAIKAAFLSESYKRGFFRDAKVGTKEQLADAFTKALPRDDFIRFREWMGIARLCFGVNQFVKRDNSHSLFISAFPE